MNALQQLLEEYQELPEFSSMKLSSVNQRGGWDSTPLHIAIYRRRPDEVETLLEAGADPNAPGEYGELPLHVAVNTKNEEIVKKLLEAGASCSGIDKNGTDAWSVASSVNFTSQLKRLADSIGR